MIYSFKNFIPVIHESSFIHPQACVTGNVIIGKDVYDVILANINRNIILENLAAIKQHLASGGVVLLSGLLTGDEPIILEEASRQQLALAQRFEMSGWICLLMVMG